MYALKITPAASVGLFVAHRAYQPKGIDQFRAALDAERLLLGTGGLVKPTEDGRGILAAHEGPIETQVENHVKEHLERAVKAALEDGKSFGYAPGQASPLHATEANEAIEKAEKRDAPRVAEGGQKKKAAGA